MGKVGLIIWGKSGQVQIVFPMVAHSFQKLYPESAKTNQILVNPRHQTGD
jgi:hypothetical protein